VLTPRITDLSRGGVTTAVESLPIAWCGKSRVTPGERLAGARWVHRARDLVVAWHRRLVLVKRSGRSRGIAARRPPLTFGTVAATHVKRRDNHPNNSLALIHRIRLPYKCDKRKQ
jgi:hypothetical protein